MAIQLRLAQASDAADCGQIIYEAFAGIAVRHGFVPDFPSVEAAIQLASAFIDDPATFAIAAEEDGRVVGSNFLGEADRIRGVGPITVDPQRQSAGIGRLLMQAVIDRTNGAAGIRLLQDSFNMSSLALYASLGFVVREPLVVMTGRPKTTAPADGAVRPMSEQDLDACNALCAQVHGFTRANELRGALQAFQPLVLECDGRITAYVTAPTFWISNHGVAESEAELASLLAGAAQHVAGPLSFLLPVRQSWLFHWSLEQGFMAAKPMTLMSTGEYRQPAGSYLPSVFY